MILPFQLSVGNCYYQIKKQACLRRLRALLLKPAFHSIIYFFFLGCLLACSPEFFLQFVGKKDNFSCEAAEKKVGQKWKKKCISH